MIPWHLGGFSTAWPQWEPLSMGYLGSRASKHCSTRQSRRQLVVASHNAGKVREIKALLGPHGIEAISAGSLGLAEPEETGQTFAANAKIKAHRMPDRGSVVAVKRAVT